MCSACAHPGFSAEDSIAAVQMCTALSLVNEDSSALACHAWSAGSQQACLVSMAIQFCLPSASVNSASPVRVLRLNSTRRPSLGSMSSVEYRLETCLPAAGAPPCRAVGALHTSQACLAALLCGSGHESQVAAL